MDTIESNKLIAEFMGWDVKNPTTIPTYLHLSNLELDNGEVMELKFHEDGVGWNWLMPVSQKIDKYFDDNLGEIAYLDDCSSILHCMCTFHPNYTTQ